MVALVSCKSNHDSIDIHQGDRDNIVDVKSLVTEFDTGDVILGPTTQVVNKCGYIFFKDYDSKEHIIQAFDSKTGKHIGSFAQFGHGPDEILITGQLQINDKERTAYLFDHGQLKIKAFNVDSALQLPDYKPWVKQRIDVGRFPSRYIWVNDTFGFGRLILPDIEHGGYTQGLCRYNLNTGDVTEIGEIHNNGDKSMMGVSTDHKLMVEAYSTKDLIVIYDFDGNVRHRIYGPEWSGSKQSNLHYFNNAVIVGDKILAAYSGTESYYAQYIHVFDLDGHYEQTLDVGHDIYDMSYAEDINSLIFTLNSDIQFGILNLEKTLGIKPVKNTDRQDVRPVIVSDNAQDSHTKESDKAVSATTVAPSNDNDSIYFIDMTMQRRREYTFFNKSISDGIVIGAMPMQNKSRSSVDIDHIVVTDKRVEARQSLDHMKPEMIVPIEIHVTSPELPLDCDLFVHYKQDIKPSRLHLKYSPD